MTDPLADDIDLSLLERYVAGHASADESARVKTWVAANGDRAKILADVKHVMGWVRDANPAIDDVDARVARLNVLLDVHHPRSAGTPYRRPRLAAMAVVALAAATLVIGLSTSWYRGTEGRWAGHVYTTTMGQRLKLTLIDGTRVTLAPGSRLRLAGHYGSGARETALEGEAYFAVVHDVQHPFSVETRGVVTHDVGTAFDVRRYDEDTITRVAVVEGAVSVAQHTLRAGDVAQVGSSAVVVNQSGDVDRYVAWMQSTLVFDRTPLREVARDIERAFGVTIVIADSTLLDKRITGTLTDRPLDLMLDVITRTVGARYEQHAKRIVIRNGVSEGDEPRDNRPPTLTTANAGATSE